MPRKRLTESERAESKARRIEWSIAYKKRKQREDPGFYLLYTTRGNARRRGIEHTITRDDIVVPALCPVRNILFRFGEGRADKQDAPSLDRIDPRKGYVPGNVQVMTYKANTWKNDMSFEDVENLYNFMKEARNAQSEAD